jgi:membrane-associated phospholipid phosphatase
MGRWWTGMSLGLSLFGTVLPNANNFASAQERAAAVASRTEGSVDSNSTRDRDAAGVEARPDHPWEDRENTVGLQLLKNIAQDQKALWIGPKNVRFADADWLVPLGGAAAAMFVTDSSYSRHLSNSPSRIKYSKDLSNYGIAAMVGVGGGLWMLGHMTHDDHKIETGILAGEAAIDSLVPVYAMKYAFGRERPLEHNYTGRFGVGGVSFPSEHAAAAWSIASVVAHEYPGPLTSLLAYGLASAVSASRITAKQHFPSDVLIGSAIGWLEGMYVYRKHHDPKIGGGEWETYAESHDTTERSTANMGSPYVPLDSWIYPAIERLIVLTGVRDAFMAMRPWTRTECLRILGEAQDRADYAIDESSEAQRLLDVLNAEFAGDLESTNSPNSARFGLESIYSRALQISGKPLFEGTHYDFGQTFVNDFGRPYEQGFNNVTGISAWASQGRFVSYVRGEFQYAPSGPALPDDARQLIAQVDRVPVPPSVSIAPVRRFHLLDAYVGMNLDNWQVTFGKQSLWWGPGESAAMMITDDASPITMFRVNRISPFKLPSILGWLGPMRVEFFLGQLEGQHFIFGESTGLLGNWSTTYSPQPIIHGERFSFKPTANVEFGFSRTTTFAGEGVPFTTHTLLRSLFSTGNAPPGTTQDPGDRGSGFDLTYRLPRLRNWLTFYADGFAEDEFSPVAYWDRSAWTAGLYLARFPYLTKLDLRVEGSYTDLPAGGKLSQGFFYWSDRYREDFTNQGDPLGPWIGRQSQGARAWATYHLTSRNWVQLNFRHQKTSQQFIPGGGTITDFGARTDYWIRPSVAFSVSIQHERWLFPVLQPDPSRNVGVSFEMHFAPAGGMLGQIMHHAGQDASVAGSLR